MSVAFKKKEGVNLSSVVKQIVAGYLAVKLTQYTGFTEHILE